MRIQEEKTELQKKLHRRSCARDITFLAARPLSSTLILRQSAGIENFNPLMTSNVRYHL